VARDDQAPRRVQVLLEEPAQLSLAQARGDRRREDHALVRVELEEERDHFFRPQDLDDRLGYAPRLPFLGGVRPEPLSCAPRLVERTDEELANVVDGLRREVALLRLQELLDIARRHVLEPLRREP